MARLSVDDSIGRDSRLDHLAMLCGWSKRETMGCLQLDIWPLCYDRVTPNLPTLDLEIAANRNAITPVKHQGGFVGALIESKMGRPATRADRSFEWRPKGWKEGDPVIIIEWPDQEFRDRVYITGAAERIAYIAKSRMAGSIGGRKSAESRSKQSKRPSKGSSSDPPSDPSRVPQGVVNPIATVPDSAPDPDLDTAPDVPQREDADPPARPKQDRKTKLPDGWEPSRSEANLEAERVAIDRGIDIKSELKNMRDWAAANAAKKVDWDATWRNWTRNSRAHAGTSRRGGGGDQLDHLLRLAGEQP